MYRLSGKVGGLSTGAAAARLHSLIYSIIYLNLLNKYFSRRACQYPLDGGYWIYKDTFVYL
jgi:hypothetical protein